MRMVYITRDAGRHRFVPGRAGNLRPATSGGGWLPRRASRRSARA